MGDLITEPGLYDGLEEATYHADTNLAPDLGRSLSASGAKVLLKSPARFHYERTHPSDATQAMDVGSVAHELILRTGTRILVVDAYDWRAKANQQARDKARAEGVAAIHRGELRQAARMAAAIRRHPLASAIFSEGKPEVSLYWIDEGTGVTCRGRIDWLRDNAIVDLKTAADASPSGFAKAAANFGYRESMAHYANGVEALTGRRLPVVLVVVEKEPPFLVGVYTLTDDDLDWGSQRMDDALRLYAECESSGEWPGYSTEIEPLSFPRWAY
jgi:hypothetical protein